MYRSFLRDHARSAGTGRRYKLARLRFAVWCQKAGLSIRSARDLDECLQRYFDAVYRAKEGNGKTRGRSIAETTLAAVRADRPEWKDKLPGAVEALKGWGKLAPSRSYPPCDRHLASLIAVWLARRGQWLEGICILTAYQALLRNKEAQSLLAEDVVFSGDARVAAEAKGAAATVMLRLRVNKTGPEQNAFVDDPAVQTLLKAAVEHALAAEAALIAQAKGEECPTRLCMEHKHGSPALLFPFSPEHLRRCIHDACAALGLPASFVFHSLRHGRATELYIAGVPVERVMILGRWLSLDSCRRYLQHGPALLIAQKIPKPIGKAAHAVNARLKHWFMKAMQQAAAAAC